MRSLILATALFTLASCGGGGGGGSGGGGGDGAPSTGGGSGAALRSPVRGAWSALQSPPCPAAGNHHCNTPNQQFAYDLLLLDASGQPVSCIGEPVFSPTAGTVVEVLDGLPNSPVPGQHFAGNHIVIQRAAREFVLLAHLSPGTIEVEVGDQVAVGAQVGECGNSGNSSTPHLHVHIQSDPDPRQLQSPGRPMVFTSIRVRGPSGCAARTAYMPVRGDVLCD